MTGHLGLSLSVSFYARVQWQRNFAKHLSDSLLNLAQALLPGIPIAHNWNLAASTSNVIWDTISAYSVA